MDQELEKRLGEMEVKLSAIYTSVEKTRKYFQIIVWITVLMIVLPAIGLVFAIPAFINSYTSALDGLI